MGVVLGVDGGNTKTDVVIATRLGTPVAWLRGRGSNSHGPGGVAGCVEVIAGLLERAGFTRPAEQGVFFLCGADVPADIDALSQEIDRRRWVQSAVVDNDTFALLRAGSDRDDAIAVICGAGSNCVGRNAAGRIARYPSLGWETGDFGGSEALGREALFLAARAEDGRGEPTSLVDVIRAHFGLPTVSAVGEAVHYKRLAGTRLGEIAPAVIAAAADADPVAAGLVERLAAELALMVRRAVADLGTDDVDVVLGGGMLTGEPFLRERVVALLPGRARPVVPDVPPVAGAVLAALQAAGAPATAADRLRAALRNGVEPEDVRGR